MSQIGPLNAATPAQSRREAALFDTAQKLEAAFLAEMLKAAGAAAPRDVFGGGTGEDQFSSFLRHAQAEQLVKAGGVGLAEHLFEALKEKTDGSL